MENPFKKLSKPEIYAVIVGTALVTAYAEYRHHKTTGSWSPFSTGTTGAAGTAANAIGASPTGTVTDPQTGQVYSDTETDPITSLTYASEISQFGSVAAAESEYSSQYGATTGSVTGNTYDTGYPSAQSQIGVSTVNGNSVYTSNSAWSQAATAGLIDIAGGPTYDGTDIASTLGAYLTGTPLTPAQASVVQTAIGEYGSPPVGSLQIINKPAASPAAPTAAKLQVVPSVIGETAGVAHQHLAYRNLGATGGIPNNETISKQDPAAGASVPVGTVVKLTGSGKTIPVSASK